MKGKITTIMAAFIAIALLTSCASVPKVSKPGLPEAKGVAKKEFTEPTVEVLEVKMEKTSMEKDALDNLVITGNAVYHPAKVGAKVFKDYLWDIRFGVYDEAGNKLFHVDGADCGLYGKAENVKPDEPFPFKAETGSAYVGYEKFLKAKTVKVERFKALQ
ncbi:MAG: hypothetical protein H5T24_08660 [Bacteroidales bacterium]|nr:hypothetical protein [Bacteroidales bacterium]